MSYLSLPRLHFLGRFRADPSTVNNSAANFDPEADLSGQRPDGRKNVYWNPYGTHNWLLDDCVVTSAESATCRTTSTDEDAVIGAQVLSVSRYPAKLVDLDPDNQTISQIWGFQVMIVIHGREHNDTALASVKGTLSPTAVSDIWNRTSNRADLDNSTLSGVFLGVLSDLTWVNAKASALLAALKSVSAKKLAIRMVADSYQMDDAKPDFTFGRIVGTVGPLFASDAPRSTPRRLAPTQFRPEPQTPSILSSFGPAGAAYDARRRVLIVDLANCIPTDGTARSMPAGGWPIVNTLLEVPLVQRLQAPTVDIKTGGVRPARLPSSLVASLAIDSETVLQQGGIMEIPLKPPLSGEVGHAALSLSDVSGSNRMVVAQEDLEGRYVDVDAPFHRLNPGDSATVTLRATRFGRPWRRARLDVALIPRFGGPKSDRGGLWPNAYPESALRLSSSSVSTNSRGVAILTLSATDPGTPRVFPNGQHGLDGQVYWITGPWADWGKIFLMAGSFVTDPPLGTPINVVVYSAIKIPARPTWDEHVGPILRRYARLFPYMKGLLDLGDYDSVVASGQALVKVLNLPLANPHHMPVTRDLSRAKRKLILRWVRTGMSREATKEDA